MSFDYYSTKNFDYGLPDSAIAQSPIEPRDSAKLLCFLNSKIEHRHVYDLVDECRPGDVVVLNDTKVRQARLILKKPTGGNIEVLLLSPTGNNLEWTALVKPSKRVKSGTILYFNGEPAVRVADRLDNLRLVHLLNDSIVELAGQVPLPPYITKRLEDSDRYQTVYANRVGSAAAPTAGLHLTKDLLKKLVDKSVEILKVDLQVGIGTFKPITAENIHDHNIHSEQYQVAEQVWEKISNANRVLAVGTTVVRTIESVATYGELSGESKLYITRDYDWKVTNRLMTNFHVPKSSLLVMVDAFIGSVWQELYYEALNNGYRFLSFGDAMLLDRKV